MAFEHQRARLTYGDEIVGNPIGDVFVENPLVTELLQVELEALQFDTHFSRYVAKDQRPEIGLTRFGANRGKLGASYFDFVCAFWKTILENLELVLKGCGH
jgi:hypothetical protein